MTLAAAADGLVRSVQALRTDLKDRLLWAIVQGKPIESDHALASRMEDLTIEILADADELIQRVVAVPSGISRTAHLVETQQAITHCQAIIRKTSRRFGATIASWRMFAALEQLARDPERREWAGWVSGVGDAVVNCSNSLEDLEDALAASWVGWGELATAVAMTSRTGDAKNPTKGQSGHGDKPDR